MEEFNHFEQLADEIDQKANQLVRAAAFKIERGAKQRAAVDTGFMRNSIYVRTEDSSDRQSGGGGPGQTLFPELEAAAHNEAWIAVGALYGIFLEYGTSKMAAQPYLTPAVEAERQPFLDAVRQLEGMGA